VDDEILTLRDVARFLKVSEKTVYRLAQSGDLPGFKAGGSWRFRRCDLDSWMESRVKADQRLQEGGDGPA